MPRRLTLLILAAGLIAPTACQKHQVPQAIVSVPSVNDLPAGDIAGDDQSHAGELILNPVATAPDAIETGHGLFVQMNCAGCHGYDLGGAMGPNLTDQYWRYGGTPAAIYRSIAIGHPQGMPAWYKTLPPTAIWQLVAYIQSKGGTVAPADYQAGLQGDLASRTPSPGPGGAPGAHTGAKGSTAASAQPPNP